MSVRRGSGSAPAETASQAQHEPEAIGLKPLIQAGQLHGRGAVSNPGGRYEPTQRAPCDDGWGTLDEPPPVRTEVLLEKELSASGYRPRVIAMGTKTDPYQPIERTLRITRGVLEVLNRFSHPVGLVTKSGLVTRDLDILAPMAARSLARVAVSVTTLD